MRNTWAQLEARDNFHSFCSKRTEHIAGNAYHLKETFPKKIPSQYQIENLNGHECPFFLAA
jgi:hypothetical protein